MPLDAACWERIQSLFYEALELQEPGRLEFLMSQCAGDPELLAEVLALLAEDARGDSLVDRDRAVVAHEVLDGSVPVPRRVGPYRVLRVLGQGGMGVVYLAEREDLGSRVALKVLRDAWLSPARRERFAREQKTLAQLNHPSIAQLYDADVLPDGTPYIVMEYVEGVPLTEYCAAHRCSVPERLRLFRAVCEAVQYAHGRAVLHRDLKPSNILVTEEGRVKLVDFGIAKQLEGLDTSTDPTQTALRLMTPAYAAPEQLRGEPVGVYTDLSALGVILYELLAGRHPFDHGTADRGPRCGARRGRTDESHPALHAAPVRGRRRIGGARRSAGASSRSSTAASRRRACSTASRKSRPSCITPSAPSIRSWVTSSGRIRCCRPRSVSGAPSSGRITRR